MPELREHLDKRFDRLEDKLDSYAERLVKVESEQGFIKGGLMAVLSVFLTAIGYLVKKYLTFIH
jgi:hypothetical protein